ncbi:hypothetical protein, partial [Hydrogenimonas sp.]|uniref:hypothetical protein n=1 Tax=Hydrogenimonas sp. TaxID=2231112 RepID=UPI0026359D06
MKSAGTKLLTLMLIGVLAFFMPGCGGDDDNDNDHVVTLQSIQVQPVDEPAEGTTDLYPLVKGNVEYEAIGVYSDGTTKVMTTEAAWSTEDDAVATAEVNGHVKFVDGGQTQVVAKVGDVSGKASLRIEALEKITLMKKSGLPTQIPAGVSVQYKAIGETTSGYTFDVSAYVDWQSSDEKIAKVEFVYPETVLRAVPQKSPVIVKVKTLAKGDATISAKMTTPAGKALEDAKEMAVSDAALLKLQIDQSDMSKPVGTTVQLSATGLFSDGTVIPLTTEVAWSSSDTSVV